MAGFRTRRQIVSAAGSKIADAKVASFELESTDGKDYVSISTDDSNPTVVLGKDGAKVAVNTATPDAQFQVTGPGGESDLSGVTDIATKFSAMFDNGTGGGNDRNIVGINTPGNGGSLLSLYRSGTEGASFFSYGASGSYLDAKNGELHVRSVANFKMDFSTNGASRMVIDADGAVAVGSAATSISSKEFEVNNGTQYIYLDPGSATESFIVNNSTRFTFYGGGPNNDALTLNYGGSAYVTQSMGASSGSLTDDTDANSAAYLATTSATNDTLVIDQRNGMMGAVTLTANITKVKIYWCNLKGAKSSTVKIKQHASAAKTVSWADVTVYSDNGSTSKGTDCFWSGGADHVMSTGTDDIDIVQITTIPTTTSAVPAYCSVIGQNFS